LVRRAPEGGIFASLATERVLETARAQAEQLPEIERPTLIEGDIVEAISEPAARGLPSHFDRIVGRNVVGRRAAKVESFASLAGALNRGGRLMLAESVPSAFKRLSELAREAGVAEDLLGGVERAEGRVFSDPENAMFNWEADDLPEFARRAGFSRVEAEVREYQDSRLIAEKDLRAWVFGRDGSREKHSYAAALAEELGEEELEALFARICAAFCNREVRRPTTVVFLSADA
ncbi:MAG: hypothetical protein ACQETQ_05330, partial [Spirochaetota bacterium]